MDMIDGAGDGQQDVVNEDGKVAAEPQQKPGVKRAAKRASYRKRNEDARLRIIESYRRGEDWKATAVANGVAVRFEIGSVFWCLICVGFVVPGLLHWCRICCVSVSAQHEAK